MSVIGIEEVADTVDVATPADLRCPSGRMARTLVTWAAGAAVAASLVCGFAYEDAPTARAGAQIAEDVGATSSAAEQTLAYSVFRARDEVFVVDPPLQIPVHPPDRDGVFVVDLPELDLYVVALHPSELVDELAAHIAVLWHEYGRARPSELTPAAIALRDRVRRRVRKV